MRKPSIWLIPALGLATILACSDGLEPVPFQGASGTVTFIGEAPDSTEWVRLAVYRELPQTPLDLLDFVAFSDTLSLSLPAAPYVLALDTGTYEWLPVIWKAKDTPLIPSALRVIGWYTAGGAPFDAPESFDVTANQETPEVNVIGDFRTMLTVDEVLALMWGG